MTDFVKMLTSIAQEDEKWMQQALQLANYAADQGEVPIGAVLVRDGICIAEGWNQSITTHDPSAHAEMVALRAAAQQIKNYRLLNTTLYVTLEPCVMCAGAIIHARIKRVVFGAYDPKTGAAGSRFDILRDLRHNHEVDCTGGVLAEQCSTCLRNFFKARR